MATSARLPCASLDRIVPRLSLAPGQPLSARPLGLRATVRPPLPPLVRAQKGFAGGDGGGGSSDVKLSPRGKVSSRPGQPPAPKKPRKEQAKQPKEAEAAAAGASATPVAASSERASTSGSPSPAQNRGGAAPPPRQQQQQQTVASTPQAVVDRMFVRMVSCAALPVVLGLAMLPVFYYFKSTNEDFPMWIVYVSQNLTFGGGLLGITYGILSTSWDPSRKGTFLGFDEFRTNLPILMNRGKD